MHQQLFQNEAEKNQKDLKFLGNIDVHDAQSFKRIKMNYNKGKKMRVR